MLLSCLGESVVGFTYDVFRTVEFQELIYESRPAPEFFSMFDALPHCGIEGLFHL